MVHTIAVIRGHVDGLTIESPYNATFVEALKTAVPADQRLFLSKKKGWLISERYTTEATTLAATHYNEVVDVRVVGEQGLAESLTRAAEAEAAAQKAKHLQWLEGVGQAQAVLLQHRNVVESECAKLQGQIDQYSPRSKSGVKGELVRRKFMLEQTLANLEKPPQQMKDVERHSALAAVRYLQSIKLIPESTRINEAVPELDIKWPIQDPQLSALYREEG